MKRTHSLQRQRLLPMTNKLVGADEAVSLIAAGDTVATGGFVGIGFAEAVARALEERYLGL